MGLYPSNRSQRRSEPDDYRWSDDETDYPVKPRSAAPPPTFPFKADVDIAELDERARPGSTWSGRACELSRGHIVITSRRMCYEGRQALIAVHLIDDRPVALFGKVTKSEYDGDGMYRTALELAAVPESDAIRTWIEHLSLRS